MTADDGGADAGAAVDAGDCPTGDDTIGEAGVAAFQDVAATAGLPADGDTCMAFEDLDGDGHVDVLLATPANLTLYLGDGAGDFHAQPIPFTPFAAMGAGTGTCAVGDVDADGKPDIVLTSVGVIEAHYLHNLGGGAFQDAQTLVPPYPTAYGLNGAGLADFDGDGWLDLVVAPWSLDDGLSAGSATCGCVTDGYACFIPGTRCQPPPVVYLNTGSGAFATTPSWLGSASDCGAANVNALGIADYDGDGRPDVFVADDWGTDRLYLNGAGMQFTEVWSTLGTKGYDHGMGVAFEDFNLDGLLDAYVSDIGSDQLYLGTGSGLAFHGEDWGVAAPTRFHSGWAPLAEDFDSDGWLDVYVTNSALVRSYADLATMGAYGQLQATQQYDLLLENVGGHGFTPDWMAQTQQAAPNATRGTAAVADYDGDGKLDILEAVGSPMLVELLHNVSAPAHFVDVRLQGKAPNVDGIGAVITLSGAGTPPSRRLVQRARGSIGSSWPVTHFGLGASTTIGSIVVSWPGGAVQTVPAPTADQVLTITQP